MPIKDLLRPVFRNTFSRTQVPLFNTMSATRFNAKAPLEDKLLQTIAKHFSMLNIEHFNTEEYKEIEDDLTYLLKVRPNQFQTPQEFFELFFYNVFAYGHGVIIPTYEKNKLASLNVADMSINNCYFLDDNFLMVNTDKSVYAVNYEDIIHIRLEARQITNNEEIIKMQNNIPNIIDENLSAMMTELKGNFDVKGVFKVGSADAYSKATASDENKKKRAKEVAERVQNGILVIDAGEEWEQQSGGLLKSSVEDMQTLTTMFYETYGITPGIARNDYTFKEYGNFANTTLYPKLRDLEQELNYKLIPKSKYKKGERLTCRIPITNGMEFKDLTNYFQTSKYNGVLNVNDIRETMGLAPIKDGDIYTGNLNMANPDGTKALKGGDDDEKQED